MSVEDVMKVNKLAQDLLDQGLVASRDDAVKRAQEMLSKEIVGNDIKVEDVQDKQTISVNDNSLDKLRNMVERIKEHSERKLDSYKDGLMALEKELKCLRVEIEDMKSRERRKAMEAKASVEKKEVQEKIVEEKESHPRKGNFNSDDVSVEKIFYFGNK